MEFFFNLPVSGVMLQDGRYNGHLFVVHMALMQKARRTKGRANRGVLPVCNISGIMICCASLVL